MPITRKVLWVVNMDTPDQEAAFISHAAAAGADTVCIRTSTNRLPNSIAALKRRGLKVYAWRWPSVHPLSTMAEANKVAAILIPAGLDGYIVDPESDNAGDSNDWNQASLKQLAADFCKVIKSAAPAGFHFGTTSGCTYPAPANRPNIPWAEFFAASDALYPQTYWRMTAAKGVKKAINGGDPETAATRGIRAWKPLAGAKPVFPMAGEIDIVTVAEIKAYGKALADRNLSDAHFYADTSKVSGAVLSAIKAL